MLTLVMGREKATILNNWLYLESLKLNWIFLPVLDGFIMEGGSSALRDLFSKKWPWFPFFNLRDYLRSADWLLHQFLIRSFIEIKSSLSCISDDDQPVHHHLPGQQYPRHESGTGSCKVLDQVQCCQVSVLIHTSLTPHHHQCYLQWLNSRFSHLQSP